MHLPHLARLGTVQRGTLPRPTTRLFAAYASHGAEHPGFTSSAVGDTGTRGEKGLCKPRDEGGEGSEATAFLLSRLLCDMGEVVMRWSVGAAAF